MDNGPFRMGNSASARGTGSRSVAPRNEAERAAPVEQAPVRKAPVHRTSHENSNDEGSNKKRFVIIGAIIAAIIVLAVAIGAWLMTRQSATNAAIDSSKYQAVFFTNGQVYFGKLHPFDSDYMKLTGVFYLQTNDGTTDTSKNPQKTADSKSNDVQLIKLGNEIHGPTDEMIVSKDQVLFFENLKSDGKVASSIDQYNKSHK